MLSDARQVLEEREHHHDGKIGYVIYRCTYGDNEKWTEFMNRLSGFVDANLEDDGTDEDTEALRLLKDCFAWDVRDDEAEFSGASISKVRAHFNEWVKSVEGLRSLTKYTNCIYADEEVVDAVVHGNPPPPTGEERRNPTAFVKVLNDYFDDSPGQYTAKHFPDPEERARWNAGDEGLPPVGAEQCRRKQVGWMKIAAMSLMPRAYNVLMSDGWYNYYRRPPAIARH